MRHTLRISFVVCILVAFVIGCTVIAFNKGDVSTNEEDSHDANGTNRAHTFDVNISPK